MTKTPTRNVRAIILAGGKGTRLRPLTAVFPKPLVPLGNRAIIEILLQRLANAGFVDVTISTGYLAELIRAVCGDGHRLGLKIDYVGEESPLGTAGPLSLIPNLTAPVIVMNGDLLTTLDFTAMIQYHCDQDADITIGVFPREVRIDFGVIDSGPDGEFQGYREKPTYHHDVSMGVNVLGSAALRHLEPGTRLDMPDLVLKVHQSGGKVACCRQLCRWLDIGRMDDYASAQEEFARDESAYVVNGNGNIQSHS
jgi:NDP-mannose synthase